MTEICLGRTDITIKFTQQRKNKKKRSINPKKCIGEFKTFNRFRDDSHSQNTNLNSQPASKFSKFKRFLIVAVFILHLLLRCRFMVNNVNLPVMGSWWEDEI